jgi:hypothetical protein
MGDLPMCTDVTSFNVALPVFPPRQDLSLDHIPSRAASPATPFATDGGAQQPGSLLHGRRRPSICFKSPPPDVLVDAFPPLLTAVVTSPAGLMTRGPIVVAAADGGPLTDGQRTADDMELLLQGCGGGDGG